MKIRNYIIILSVIFWIVIIFLLSNQNGITSSNLSNIVTMKLIKWFYPNYNNLNGVIRLYIYKRFSYLTRKTAHMIEYLILYLLVFFIFSNMKKNKRIFLTFLIVALFSIFDEIHQTFIYGRYGGIDDVFIDLIPCVVIMIFFSFMYENKE